MNIFAVVSALFVVPMIMTPINNDANWGHYETSGEAGSFVDAKVQWGHITLESIPTGALS